MFCCRLLCVRSSIAIILMGKRELVALLGLSSWCLVVIERLFLAAPQGCLRFMIVVFPDHTHLLFLYLKLGMELTKEHCILEFNETPWMESYIQLNTEMRKKNQSLSLKRTFINL